MADERKTINRADTKITLSSKRKRVEDDPPLVDSRSVPPSRRFAQGEHEDEGDTSSSSSDEDDIPLTELYRLESESSYIPSDEDDDMYEERKQRVPVNQVHDLHDDIVWAYLVGHYQTIFDEVRTRHAAENRAHQPHTAQTMVGVGILDAYNDLWQLKTRIGGNRFPTLSFNQKARYHRNLLTKGEICRLWLRTFYEIASEIGTITTLKKARLAGRLQGYWWFLSQMVDQTAREAEMPVTTSLQIARHWNLFYSCFRERALSFMPKTVPRMRQMFRDIFLKPVYIKVAQFHMRRATAPSPASLMKLKVAMDVMFCVLPANKQARR